jgi:HK97 family phage portal protein
MALLRRRTTEDRALTVKDTIPAAFPDPAGGALTTSAAMRIADVFACVRVLAESAASLPLIAYRHTDQGRVRAGGRAQELIDRPAPATTTASFVGQLMSHLTLWGNAFIAKYRNAGGQVAQLGLLAPDSVTVEIERGEPVYTVYSLMDGVSRYTPADILHVRAIVSEDGILGMTPIRQGAGALTLNSELSRHAKDTMTRGARLSGVLSTPSDVAVDPDNIAAIKEQIQESWVGPENSGGIAFVTGGLAFSPLSMPLADAQFIEQRQLSTAEVCRLFRIPPWMVGAPSGDSLTYSNVESQAQSFVVFSMRPWLIVVEQALTSDPDLSVGTVYFEFLVDGLLRGDSKTRSEVYTAALNPQTGWMTRDEVRKLENLPAEGSQT